jgi:RNA polymerase sigma-70 factor (ECF subfamily)
VTRGPEIRVVIDRAAIESAKRAWPGIEIDADEFAQYATQRAVDRAAHGELHIADLYLACACARGDRRALRELDRRFLRDVGSFVARLDPSKAFADEVTQLLRHKLLVAGSASRAKIADYRGRGPLAGWLRVAAIRVARDLIRSRDRRTPIEREHGDELRPPVPDPELQLVKGRYGKEFRTAFQATLSALSPKDRNVLCLYYLDGTSSSAIGAMYRVQGATVRLWIKQLREKILEHMRSILRETMGLDTTEFDHLMVVVQSQLDLSISRYLKKRA